MNTQEATTLLKAINRRLRRTRAFQGGTQYGIDYNTWCITFPRMARSFTAAARVLVPGCTRPVPNIWATR